MSVLVLGEAPGDFPNSDRFLLDPVDEVLGFRFSSWLTFETKYPVLPSATPLSHDKARAGSLPDL